MPTDRVDGYIQQFRNCLKDPSKPFAMLARIPIQDGKQESFEEAFAAAIAATRNETGVLVYNLNREAADGTR